MMPVRTRFAGATRSARRAALLLAALLPGLSALPARAQAPRLTPLPPLDSAAALATLRQAVDGARIVLLGEPEFGDGGALEAKRQLIGMLHRDLGFDVLVFESGQLELAHLDRAIGDTAQPVRNVAAQGLRALWAAAPAVQATLAYVRESRAGHRPITLAGFDIQPSGADPAGWAKLVIATLSGAGVSDRELARFSEIGRRIYEGDGVAWGTLLPAFIESIQGLQALAQAHRQGLERTEGKDGAALLERSLEDALVFYRLAHDARTGRASSATDQTARQQRLGDNLLWLAHYRFPDRKIIVWLQNEHALYTPATVQDTAGQPFLPGVISPGSMLRSAFQDDVFSIALTAASGTRGHPLERGTRAVPRPLPGSLEDACRGLRPRHGFALLRSASADRAPYVSHLLGGTPTRAAWSTQFDALLCLQTTRPAHGRAPAANPR